LFYYSQEGYSLVTNSHSTVFNSIQTVGDGRKFRNVEGMGWFVTCLFIVGETAGGGLIGQCLPVPSPIYIHLPIGSFAGCHGFNWAFWRNFGHPFGRNCVHLDGATTFPELDGQQRALCNVELIPKKIDSAREMARIQESLPETVSLHGSVNAILSKILLIIIFSNFQVFVLLAPNSCEFPARCFSFQSLMFYVH
jgi:hypothetical protein